MRVAWVNIHNAETRSREVGKEREENQKGKVVEEKEVTKCKSWEI